MKTTPFRIEVKQAVLDDLRERLARTRWPDEVPGAGWSMGADIAFMKRLAAHWQSGYDWRKHEAALNAYPQLIARVGDLDIHCVHVRSKKPNATPLLLIHSYPDSFVRFMKALPYLEDFHVVIPSLPGFGFSSHVPLATDAIADTLAALMKGLGYERFVAGGGDGHVPMALSRRHSAAVKGIYCLDVGYPDGSTDFSKLSKPEVEFAQWIQSWWMREGAFNMIQSTKPQSLAVAMNDSPLGLLAWLMILFTGGPNGQPEGRLTSDDLLTNAMVYWVTGTIGTAMRSYLEQARVAYASPPPPKPPRSDVPAAFARMPLDAPVPREWAERNVNLVQFTVHPEGSHHSSWDVPRAFAEDVRSFVAKL